MSRAVPSVNARLAAAFALLGLVLLATLAATRGPEPASDAAPPDAFSAARARAVLQRIVGDGIPHPVGSAQNAIVRDRILAEFRALGYASVVERDFACAPTGSCAWVENIVATLPGREPGGTVILDAHYDSVPAGPGGGDDATGVATVLEVARALSAQPPPRHAVVFLVDDGEEAGLLGAEAFVRRHQPADFAAALVLEARGSSGLTLMFETSEDNRALVAAYARSVPRPATSSVYFSVYQRLPNGTNFTVFKEAGVPGMAAAFIGDPAQYHTPLNHVGNVPDATLQHMGDTALAVVRELAGPGLGAERGNASYFDVLTLAVVRWPEALNLPAAGLALALLVLLARRQIGAGRFTGRELLGSLVAGLAPLVLAALGGFAVGRLADLRLDHAAWPASGHWLAIAAWACGLAAVALAALPLARRGRAAAAWTAVWIDASLLGIAAAALLPGAAYLWTLPAVAAVVVGGLSWLRVKAVDTLPAVLVPLALGALLVFPFAVQLVEAMGSGIAFGIAVAAASAFVPLLPLLVGTAWPARIAAGSSALAVGALGAVFALPVYTPQAPRPLSLVWQMDRGAATAHWVAEMASETVPAALARAADWRRAALPSLAIGRDDPARPRTVAAAPPLPFAFPEATIVGVEARGDPHDRRMLVHVRLVSARGAPAMRLRFPARFDPRLVAIADLPQDGGKRLSGGIVVHTVPPEGIVVAVGIDAAAAGSEFAVDDETPGLPAEGAALVAARAADAVPLQRGDRTVLSTVGQVPALPAKGGR